MIAQNWLTLCLLLSAIPPAPGGAPPNPGSAGAALARMRFVDAAGEAHALADYAGRYIVLEWIDRQCGFVNRHYASGNAQRLQRTWRGKQVVWLTFLYNDSSHPDYARSAAAAASALRAEGTSPTALIVDERGALAKTVGIKTTFEMQVVDPTGALLYDGAMDDQPTRDPNGLAQAKNYVAAALTAALAGEPIATPQTAPYGCARAP